MLLVSKLNIREWKCLSWNAFELLSRACNTTGFYVPYVSIAVWFFFLFYLSFSFCISASFHLFVRVFFYCSLWLWTVFMENCRTAQEAISKSDENALHIHCLWILASFKSWSPFACDTIADDNIDDKGDLLNHLKRSMCVNFRRVMVLYSFFVVFFFAHLTMMFVLAVNCFSVFIIWAFVIISHSYLILFLKKHSGLQHSFRFLLSADAFRSTKTWIVTSFFSRALRSVVSSSSSSRSFSVLFAFVYSTCCGCLMCW